MSDLVETMNPIIKAVAKVHRFLFETQPYVETYEDHPLFV